ncbi:MAG: GFA family protein [Acidiferrobacterales bacterium]
MRRIQGGCHCGNIRFEFSWPLDSGDIPVRICSCSFCKKHNVTYTSHPKARLTANINDSALVNEYLFGTNTAEFHICSRCGVVPFVTSEIDGHQYAVVNVNAFDRADTLELTSEVRDYEHETTEQRLARRKKVWTPAVTITRG